MDGRSEIRSPGAGRSLWSAGAIVCLVAAGAALVAGRAEASFVLAALGALAWFLNVRHNLKRDGDGIEDEADDEAADGADEGETEGRDIRQRD